MGCTTYVSSKWSLFQTIVIIVCSPSLQDAYIVVILFWGGHSALSSIYHSHKNLSTLPSYQVAKTSWSPNKQGNRRHIKVYALIVHFIIPQNHHLKMHAQDKFDRHTIYCYIYAPNKESRWQITNNKRVVLLYDYWLYLKDTVPVSLNLDHVICRFD
jgi:hypothetical protein